MHPTRHQKFLFIGDSITDCHRLADPERLGDGYVRLIRDYLAAKSPADCPQIINSGTSGHKITDLRDRWQRDLLAHRPDLVSIMIGINDVWHALMPGGQGVPIEEYIQTYRELLEKTKRDLPSACVILCQPTVISPPAPSQGNDLLKPYVTAVNNLATEFQASALVKLHDTFESAHHPAPIFPGAPTASTPAPQATC